MATGNKMTSLKESIGFCRKSLEHNPEYGLAYYKAGDDYLKLGNLPEAAHAYEKAAFYMPIVLDIWQKLLMTYQTEGSLTEQKRIQDRIQEIQKTYAE